MRGSGGMGRCICFSMAVGTGCESAVGHGGVGRQRCITSHYCGEVSIEMVKKSRSRRNFLGDVVPLRVGDEIQGQGGPRQCWAKCGGKRRPPQSVSSNIIR
jgi:hypothetical protein